MIDIIFSIIIIILYGMALFLGYKNSNQKNIGQVFSVLFIPLIIIAIGLLLAIIDYTSCMDAINNEYCSLYKIDHGLFFALGYNFIIIVGIILAFYMASRVDKRKHKKEKNIKEIKKDIIIFNCDNCGAEVSENAKKCPNCGSVFVGGNSNEEQFVCDNCGSLVDSSAKKCPKCGEKFDEEDVTEEKSNKNKEKKKKKEHDMDKKYSDLNKLKKLLDNKIITKEEFEKEKKKILRY